MKWGALSSVFLFSIIKFMFAPLSGPILKLNFIETYLAACSGAIFGALIFYFGAEILIRYAHKKRVEKMEYALANNLPVKIKRKFTRTNKFIVRIKMKLGIYGIAMFAPFIMSIPLGSIVTAKFYGKQKITFPLIVLGIGLTGLLTTGLTYLFS